MSAPRSPHHPAVASTAAFPALDPELATRLPADEAVHAAIDIGTNSIHLLVARSTPAQRFEVLAQEKEVVRLGHGTGDMVELADDAVDRGIAALRRFRQVAEIWDADITAVATSAVREAENHDVFIRRAHDEADIQVEIISGVEEARLIHVGVLHALPVYDQRLLVVDIGGGSTELLVGHRAEVLGARSLKLGAIRLTERFFPDERLDPASVEACRRYVAAFLQPAARELAAHGFEVAAGCSGTIETLAAMAVASRGDDPTRPLNNETVTAAELDAAIDALLAAPTARARAKLPGMDAKRADIIVAGALVLEGVVRAMGIEELRISSYALREGVLLDRLRHLGDASLRHLSNLRRASVLQVAEALDPDLEHSAHLTELALSIFDQTQHLHGLGDLHRELLEAAGLLHNVGLFINHSAHHKHSYYVIRNSERLLGFTDHEIELIAVVARYHRKSDPRPRHPEFSGLSKSDRRVVSVLAGILRIAIGLDRTHSSIVEAVRVEQRHERLVIAAVPVPGTDVSLELYSAAERAGLLAGTLGVEIDVELAG